MTTKDEFLSRIASKLGRERITKAPLRDVKGAPDFWQKIQFSEAERISRFVSELEKIGGSASVYESLQDMHQGLSDLLTQLNPATILTWQEQPLKDWELQSVLSAWKCAEWENHSFLKQAEQCQVGITAVDFAIATTGTLVVCTSAAKMRSASLLPSVHIALIRAEQIQNRMGEVLQAFAEYKAEQAPSSIHFISGPSRSADIENDLSIGVHGPAALHVLVCK